MHSPARLGAYRLPGPRSFLRHGSPDDADLSVPTGNGTLVFPHFADGGGWTTQLVLVNPTDNILSGTVQFVDRSGRAATVVLNNQSGSSFTYAVPARTSQKFQTSGIASAILSGSMRVVPAAGATAPSGPAIFSFRNGGITVTEAGVLAEPTGTAFRLYTEASGSIQTGPRRGESFRQRGDRHTGTQQTGWIHYGTNGNPDGSRQRTNLGLLEPDSRTGFVADAVSGSAQRYGLD